ncbi:tryptophan-rich sensory protein [Leifsonia aquatica]|uniref:tryptophan-rich sensory protein n=1 Tax=Leifsonia aquatica TaxID=144185 RepID=UPI000469459E|nr:tryptophan-rich sensory protein [Leifsonia aquatica]
MSTLTGGPARTIARPVAADRVRQSTVIAAAVVALIGAVVGSGLLGGTPIPRVAGGALGADATLLAPAGPAFAIWTVIYAGLVLYAIWQALPSQAGRERQRRLGYWMVASLLLNAAWILSVQAGLLALSVAVIAVLLAVLVVAFVRLRDRAGGTMADTILFDGTVGLYLGWVMVATVANIAAGLTASGFDGFGWSPHAWGLVVVAVVAVLGCALAVWDRGRLAPAAATSWGLAWVGVARLEGSLPSAPVAVSAFAAAGLILLVAVAVRVVRR